MEWQVIREHYPQQWLLVEKLVNERYLCDFTGGKRHATGS